MYNLNEKLICALFLTCSRLLFYFLYRVVKETRMFIIWSKVLASYMNDFSCKAYFYESPLRLTTFVVIVNTY